MGAGGHGYRDGTTLSSSNMKSLGRHVQLTCAQETHEMFKSLITELAPLARVSQKTVLEQNSHSSSCPIIL